MADDDDAGFKVSFGDEEVEDWESVALDKLTIVRFPSISILLVSPSCDCTCPSDAFSWRFGAMIQQRRDECQVPGEWQSLAPFCA